MSWEKGRPTGRCGVCGHQERTRIELLLAGGAGQRAVGDKFGLSKDAIHRHWHGHVSDERKAALLLGPVQVQALAAKVAEESESVIDHHKATRAGLYQLYQTALEAGDKTTGALLAGKLTEVNNSIGRITGELSRSPLVQQNSLTVVMQSPQMQELLEEIVNVLEPYPDALEALGSWLERRKTPEHHALPAIEHRPEAP